MDRLGVIAFIVVDAESDSSQSDSVDNVSMA